VGCRQWGRSLLPNSYFARCHRGVFKTARARWRRRRRRRRLCQHGWKKCWPRWPHLWYSTPLLLLLWAVLHVSLSRVHPRVLVVDTLNNILSFVVIFRVTKETAVHTMCQSLAVPTVVNTSQVSCKYICTLPSPLCYSLFILFLKKIIMSHTVRRRRRRRRAHPTIMISFASCFVDDPNKNDIRAGQEEQEAGEVWVKDPTPSLRLWL